MAQIQSLLDILFLGKDPDGGEGWLGYVGRFFCVVLM